MDRCKIQFMRFWLFGVLSFAFMTHSFAVGLTDIDYKLMDLCHAYVVYQPGPDVVYEEGVDAYGNAVTPADLTSASGPSVEQIIVPVTLDLSERLGIQFDGLRQEAIIGVLSVFEGIVHFNDQPLSSQQNEAFLKECAEKGF